MHNVRQEAILKIIRENEVSDQSTLLQLLNIEGIVATQATVSRDMKKLNLKKQKSKDANGRIITKYITEEHIASSLGNTKFKVLLKDSMVSINDAQNIIVIKTHSGMAQAVCAAFDALNTETVVGSLAGDDTILIICKTSIDAQNVMNYLNEMTKEG